MSRGEALTYVQMGQDEFVLVMRDNPALFVERHGEILLWRAWHDCLHVLLGMTWKMFCEHVGLTENEGSWRVAQVRPKMENK